ncbi:stearoyl-CoA desaturase 5-like isoform X1 [Mercenaria mercenaria]|uniref:stearoyl-CoA desaturase 5-like isoform X1 n=1 Tax=Mercenaria mercenaria TaxID=6596 RepID=UPI00234E4AB5|nr:stearoyl-CoA desaturase 5-like isoform X1 [Mercenaria mercenaria]
MDCISYQMRRYQHLFGVGILHQSLVFTQTEKQLKPYLLKPYFLYIIGGLGITAGAHRLWAHRSYRARLPMRIVLAVFNSLAFQNDVIEWARDHRVHHKFSETNADPHNAKRGFFFAHVGWLLVRKHPDVNRKGKLLGVSDLMKDPVLRFQRRFYLPSVIVLCFLIPTIVPVFCWSESVINAYFICATLRYIVTLNFTWLVNSLAHMWGMRPYDVNINPAENVFVAMVSAGEGFHNYHHTFPQDYSTSEFGWCLNITKFFIDTCAVFGLSCDRKTIPEEIVEQRRRRTGDTRVVTAELKQE